MDFDWWTFGLQTVNALVLVWLLARFLFRPVSRIIAERQAAAHAVLDEAEATRAAAETALAEAEARKDAVARDRADLIAAAEAEAATRKRQMLDDARAEAERTQAEARADLARLHKAEAHRWRAEAAALAVDMTERLLDRLPDDARAAAFADGLAEAVRTLPDAAQARIGTDGPVVLRAARDLAAGEQAEVAERLAAVLGHPVDVRVETDESLIAGLELHTPHAIVRNTLRADLDGMAERIAADDHA
ncbi:F0F1 ATP synthase subunit delta [Sagittula sp. MA-2]|uniref:F0F1 ATP synthase subunit delta n=1 Tax=Sagittula sp. MA-2 TaxID=3048007 RepID=UPI0024C38EA1|nr:F0F1 ATP synthase subunit delta [Sagittula sp. MA-2]WHZ36599.1 F0F1 ATP synthase subunit delta [Sagittula sp. MA-2]